MANITLRSVKGSALTFTEADNNFDNLNTDKIESVSEDTAPSLGGNLDVGDNRIVTTGAGIIGIDGVVELGSFPFEAAPEFFIQLAAITAAANTNVMALGVDLLSEPGNARFLIQPESVSLEINSEAIIIAEANSFGVFINENPVLEITTAGVKINDILYPDTIGTTGQVLSVDQNFDLTFSDGKLVDQRINTGSFVSVAEDSTETVFASINTDSTVDNFSIYVRSETDSPSINLLYNQKAINFNLTSDPNNPVLTLLDGSITLNGNLDISSNSIVNSDEEDSSVRIGGILNLQGLPLLGAGTSIGALTSSSNDLVLGLNNADTTKPFVFITNSDPNDSDRLISLSMELGEPILDLSDNRILAFRPMTMATFTTTERNNLTPENGDVIYNTSDHKFQGYADGAWVNLN